MEEIWKPVPGYEGKYEVSDLGRVRSLNYHRTGKIKVLSERISTNGYCLVNLYKNSIMETGLVHLFEWKAFNGPIPEGMQVNHINEDKTDNRIENLNLMTPKENTNWGTRNKRAGKSISRAMTNGANSKKVMQLSLNGDIVNIYPSIAEAERQTGYKSQHIWRCCAGKRPTANNYKWKYV